MELCRKGCARASEMISCPASGAVKNRYASRDQFKRRRNHTSQDNGAFRHAGLRQALDERIGEMEKAEFLDELTGLISLGYILSDKVTIRTMEDVERTVFRVNASYARDLRDALNPSRRREERSRRRRRE